jgi:hypothetical protein
MAIVQCVLGPCPHRPLFDTPTPQRDVSRQGEKKESNSFAYYGDYMYAIDDDFDKANR